MNMSTEIRKIAVLGAGTMGPGIAQSYASGGFQVSLLDVSAEARTRAQDMLRANLDTFVEERVLTAQEAEAILGRIALTGDLGEAVDGAGFVQETVSEKPAVKESVFRQLDELLPEEALIVSNASSLDPFQLMPERRLPRFAAAHWFAPPHILPLVEVARGPKTADETMDAVMALLKQCGKTPVRLEKFVPGYLINRLQILLNTEIFYLLDEGVCTPEMLDLAVKASLMPRGLVLGLVQRYDFTGLDISANNIINGSYQMPETSKRPRALFDHVEKNELGIKTGKGFFDYGGRSREELSKLRDRRLLRVFSQLGDLLTEHI